MTNTNLRARPYGFPHEWGKCPKDKGGREAQP